MPRARAGIARLAAFRAVVAPGTDRMARATRPVGSTVRPASRASEDQEPRPVAQVTAASRATAATPAATATGARNWKPGTRLSVPSPADSPRRSRAIEPSTSACRAIQCSALSRTRASRPGGWYGGSAAARIRSPASRAAAECSARNRCAAARTAASSARWAPAPCPPASGRAPAVGCRAAAARRSSSSARTRRAARSSAYVVSTRASVRCAPAACTRSRGSSGACSSYASADRPCQAALSRAAAVAAPASARAARSASRACASSAAGEPGAGSNPSAGNSRLLTARPPPGRRPGPVRLGHRRGTAGTDHRRRRSAAGSGSSAGRRDPRAVQVCRA